jgi:hypothetical protein
MEFYFKGTNLIMKEKVPLKKRRDLTRWSRVILLKILKPTKESLSTSDTPTFATS